MAELEKVVESAAPRRDWHDIEPLLKWGAVAYLCGFGIVLVHTHRLGVPMLQLMEPVNVWIGLPVAVLIYFLDKIYSGVRLSIRTTMGSLRDREKNLQKLATSETQAELFWKVSDLWVKALALFASPLGLAGFTERFFQWMMRAYFRFIEKRFHVDPLAEWKATKLGAEINKEALAQVDRVLSWTVWIAALVRFANLCIYCFVGLVVCWVYVEMYSEIPQTLGGGKPMEVTLVISPDAIPKSKGFANWRGADGESGGEAKEGLAVPVTLYFRNEHELIVRKGGGPAVSLSEHAVEGIVFPSR